MAVIISNFYPQGKKCVALLFCVTGNTLTGILLLPVSVGQQGAGASCPVCMSPLALPLELCV